MTEKQELAERIVKYSLNVKPNEKVLVEYSDCETDFLNLLQLEIFKAKAYPFFKEINRTFRKNELEFGSEEFFENMVKHDKVLYENMDCVVLILGSNNIFEFSNVNATNKALFESVYTKQIQIDIRLKKRWVLLRWPTTSFAQLSKMGTKEFEEYFFNVCNLNYEKLHKASEKLKKLIEKTDKVKIVAPNTNLTFSIKGMPAIICSGQCNLPDGEVYTAPIKNSINGEIMFNIPSMQNGFKFEKIWLKFENGKVVDFNCNNNNLLKTILDLDDGSRYVGEFAFGINPHVKTFINDILFDEKMCGSLHMALGNAYDDCFNGNTSALHWDLILNQFSSFGGGEIWFDGVKIRENGLFILPELVALNPENLI